MKIIEAINQIDSQTPNTYSYNEKLSWLSRLDFMVKRLIIDTHEGGDDVEFTGYDASTDQNTEMLVPAPFDEMYIRWLEAQIDYANEEYDRYNNSILMYQTEYDGFSAWYNRNHMPKSKSIQYF